MISRPRRWALAVGIPAVLIVVLILVWDWDWFIPFVESRASAAIGRQVSIAHLDVHLGLRTKLVADDVEIANPDGFRAAAPFVRIAKLGITVDVADYVFHQRIVIPLIDLDQPAIEAVALPSGQDNYRLHPSSKGRASSASPQIGKLTIEHGQAHVVMPQLKADFHLAVQTKLATGTIAQNGEAQEVAVDAHGTYASQSVAGTLIAGSLLTLRDGSQPFPVDLHLANGSTHVSLTGTVQNPLALKGVDLELALSGETMANLYPLTGIPIPATAPYQVHGHLSYADGKIRFEPFHGLVGHSDLEGSVAEVPGQQRPDVTLDLTSHRIDLADLGGFIGAPSARASEGGADTEQTRTTDQKARGDSLLPATPIDIPKLKSADIHLQYHADHIEGRSMPLDKLTVTMDVVDGAITLHPIRTNIGSGNISGTVAITPSSNKQTHLKADFDFNRVDVATLLAATHTFTGSGAIGGKADIDATGNSIASWAANGNGGLSVSMSGGNVSTVLVSLAGLEFGNALVGALGLPQQTEVRCFVGDLSLKSGLVQSRTLMLDTGVAIVRGAGDIDLRDQRINYRLHARPKHFSVGSIPAPIEITGTLRDPSIKPALMPLAARGAAAVALAFVAPPLALLATIQLGVDDPHSCTNLVDQAKQEARSGTEGAPLDSRRAEPSSARGKPVPTSGSRSSPNGVVGKGAAAVRKLNQRELDKIKRSRP